MQRASDHPTVQSSHPPFRDAPAAVARDAPAAVARDAPAAVARDAPAAVARNAPAAVARDAGGHEGKGQTDRLFPGQKIPIIEPCVRPLAGTFHPLCLCSSVCNTYGRYLNCVSR